MFLHNPALKTISELFSALETVLITDLVVPCFAKEDEFEFVSKAMISRKPKSANTLERMWKIYKHLQNEFFHVQLFIFRIGSPSHSLNALGMDYNFISSRGFVCPTFSEMAFYSCRARPSLFAITIEK